MPTGTADLRLLWPQRIVSWPLILTQTHKCSEVPTICPTHLFPGAARFKRYAHMHMCKYSCWCLRLVAALKLAHICSCIDPAALCGCSASAKVVCGSVCVCLYCKAHILWSYCWGFVRGGSQHCPLLFRMTLMCIPCVCGCPCICVCVWEWSLSLAQMPRLNPSPAVLHSSTKLEHLAPS